MPTYSCSHPQGCPGGVSIPCPGAGGCCCGSKGCRCGCFGKEIEGVVAKEVLSLEETISVHFKDYSLCECAKLINSVTGIGLRVVAEGSEKPVTLELENTPIREVLARLKETTRFEVSVD